MITLVRGGQEEDTYPVTGGQVSIRPMDKNVKVFEAVNRMSGVT